MTRPSSCSLDGPTFAREVRLLCSTNDGGTPAPLILGIFSNKRTRKDGMKCLSPNEKRNTSGKHLSVRRVGWAISRPYPVRPSSVTYAASRYYSDEISTNLSKYSLFLFFLPNKGVRPSSIHTRQIGSCQGEVTVHSFLLLCRILITSNANPNTNSRSKVCCWPEISFPIHITLANHPPPRCLSALGISRSGFRE